MPGYIPLDFDKWKGVHSMHSDQVYTDQHPDDLQLTLVEGDLDRSQFQLLAGQTQVLAGVRIEATVIGASHVVSYDTGSFVLHEVFACVGLENVSSWPLKTLVSSPVRRNFPDMTYAFSVRRVPWHNDEPDELHSIVAAAGNHGKNGGIGVVQDFPRGDAPATPKTVIVGYEDPRHRRIVIETAHSYPNVPGLVLSRSVLAATGGIARA